MLYETHNSNLFVVNALHASVFVSGIFTTLLKGRRQSHSPIQGHLIIVTGSKSTPRSLFGTHNWWTSQERIVRGSLGGCVRSDVGVYNTIVPWPHVAFACQEAGLAIGSTLDLEDWKRCSCFPNGFLHEGVPGKYQNQRRWHSLL
jgi:hypothetical protein